MYVNPPAQSLGAVAEPPADVRVDFIPRLREDGTVGQHAIVDPTSPQRIRPTGDAGAKRGRGRPKLGSVSPRTGETIRSVEERKSPTGWLRDVQASLTKEDGLTDGKLPLKLAQAVALRSESMTVLDVVAAFEKCENMALKLKAAKFLKDTSKGTIEDIRKQAFAFMNESEEEVSNGQTTE